MAKELRIFIASRCFEAKMRRGEEGGESEYMEVLQKKGDKAFLQKEYKQALKKARSSSDPRAEAELLLFWGKLLSQGRLAREADFQGSLEYIAKARKAILRDYHYSQRELDNLQAFTELSLWVQDGDREFSELAEMTHPPVPDDDYLSFHREVIAIYQTPKQFHSDKMIRAISYLDRSQTRRLPREKLKSKMLNNLGLEYMLRKEYDLAIQSFQKALKNRGTLSVSARRACILNLATTHLKAGQFQQSLEVFEQLESGLPSDHPYVQKISGLRLICLIRMGDIADAWKSIPANLKDGSTFDYFYLRLTLALIYFLGNDPELALRETTNLSQALRKNGNFHLFRRGSLWLHRWISLQSEPLRERFEDQRNKLAAEIEEVLSDFEGAQRSSEPIKIIRELVLGEFPMKK